MGGRTTSNKTGRACLYVGLAMLGLVVLVVAASVWGLKGMGY